MLVSIVILESLFFFVMGSVALASPRFVTSLFGELEIGADMRNEVRAVYGGFGVAIGALLLVSMWMPGIQSGVLITVGVALLGMALGRFISFLIEPVEGKLPALFAVVEVFLGGALLLASWINSY